MKWTAIVFIGFLGMLVSCNSKIDSETYDKTQQKGNEIANLTQATLLANVGKAIQQGGPEYAVEFCNVKASTIVDSLNQVNNCVIARVSEKNRNPANPLQTKADVQMWEAFKASELQDTVIQNDMSLVYYKRINIAMPACLKCHGTPGTDINSATLEKLNRLYPNDLAKGYALNDFRGLWKISFYNLNE